MSKGATEEAPSAGHVFKPETSNSMYDDNARTNSPLRQFWDKQTKQSMDANIAIERKRRQDQGWDGEGGNVMTAMKDLRERAKEGEYVDEVGLKNDAKAALATILRKSKNGTNSSQDLTKEADDGTHLAATGDIARNYVQALEKERKELQEDREARQKQHMDDLKAKGHFFRKHPYEGESTDAKGA